MAKEYKVWVCVEEYNDEAEGENEYVDLDLPFSEVRTFDNEHDARAFADLLQDAGEDIDYTGLTRTRKNYALSQPCPYCQWLNMFSDTQGCYRHGNDLQKV